MVFVSDYNHNRIQKFDPSGRFELSFGRAGTGPGEFAGPASLAITPDGNLVVCDYTNHRLQLFDPSGRFLETIGATAGLRNPWGVGVNGTGDIFVTEYANGRVQIFPAP